MKRIFAFSLLCFAAVTTVSAQAEPVKVPVVAPTDTVVMEDVRTGEKRRVRIILPGQEEGVITFEKSVRDTVDTDTIDLRRKKKTPAPKPKSHPIFGITFSRVDLGLVRLVDNGSFSLSGDNEVFRNRPGKTVNFGFDVLQAGYRFNDNFRIFLSGGFDWTYIRLREDVVFQQNTTPLTWEISDTDYTRNRLTSTYLRLPLTFEIRSGHNSKYGRTRFAFGPEGGFLLKGTQRLRSSEFGRQKFTDDYNFTTFRYGAFARFGVGSFGIYAKYYFNDLFESSPAQSGLTNFNFGVMLGF